MYICDEMYVNKSVKRGNISNKWDLELEYLYLLSII